MDRTMLVAVLVACLPWLALLAVSIVALRWLARLSGARLRLGSLKTLHGDQAGSVQSLSFVLTLPLFIMVLLFIVQVSQLTIGTVVVHYSAFAAARSAIVWVPARTPQEWENCISSYRLDPGAGIDGAGQTYTVSSGSPKYRQIEMAAALACAPISPSRGVAITGGGGTGANASGGASGAAEALAVAYQGMAPSQNAAGIPRRLANKLAYSLANTEVKVSFLHKDDEPPLARYDLPGDRDEFYPNEIGWQDPIKVTVTHQLALLPGPGRLLARQAVSLQRPVDRVSQRIENRGREYVYPLTASATLGNEGEKSMVPYVDEL